MADSIATPLEVQVPAESGAPDVVVGLPNCQTPDDLLWTLEDLKGIKVLVVYPDAVAPSDAETGPGAGFSYLRVPWPGRNPFQIGPPDINGAYQPAFQAAVKFSAKACCVWTSSRGLTVSTLREMADPVLRQDFGLAIPRYAPMKFAGLINSGIVAPLTRALYGKRISYPLANDLCFSQKLVEQLVLPEAPRTIVRSVPWSCADAIWSGIPVCQVNLPFDQPAPAEAPDLSTALAGIAGPVFLEMERLAAYWQKVQGSLPVPSFGVATQPEEERGAVEVQRMVDTFQLAYRNLSGVWGVALPPATLLELKKLTRMSAEQFLFSDEVWVRTVYDFALAHRQRAISRDHLLRAMTPLYLAWVASYAVSVRNASGAAAQQRLEQLSLAYEREKPYLIARWRWPDRFNP